MVKIEQFVVDDKILLQQVYLTKTNQPIIEDIDSRSIVYCDLLDEFLNFKETSVKDDTYRFILDCPMCAMEKFHDVRLKSFNNTELIMIFI